MNWKRFNQQTLNKLVDFILNYMSLAELNSKNKAYCIWTIVCDNNEVMDAGI